MHPVKEEQVSAQATIYTIWHLTFSRIDLKTTRPLFSSCDQAVGVLNTCLPCWTPHLHSTLSASLCNFIQPRPIMLASKPSGWAGGAFVRTTLPMFGFVVFAWWGLSQLMESKLAIRVSWH